MKALLFGLMFCSGVCLQAQYKFSGVINSGESPVHNALLILDQKFAVTSDEKGYFEFTSLSKGEHTLLISHISFQNIEQRIFISQNQIVNFNLSPDVILSEEVVILANRASINDPFAQTNLTKKQIEKDNLGSDLPFLLRKTPSMVVTSDAGNGVGYTGMRIRGSDATRINVTINGIPLNDAESHQVFWVDLPDFASSLESIQIQRGVGTSTHGSGAFGASVNLETQNYASRAGAEINNSYGSFNTWKNTVKFTSGLVKDRFTFEGRFSNITSEGFVDRASSDLKSFFTQGTYSDEKNIIKAIVFGGKEKTYQSWWGVPESKLRGEDEALSEHIANNGYTPSEQSNLINADNRTYNYYTYQDQVDDYQQDHYQLHWLRNISERLNFNLSIHYTAGLGFFEQFRESDELSDYNLSPIMVGDTTILESDLIRRRWLDNDFYGFNSSLQGNLGKTTLNTGIAFNRYEGLHFGEIIWSEWATGLFPGQPYYQSDATKDEFSAYTKWQVKFNEKISVLADAQIRAVNYSSLGNDNDLQIIDFDENYLFFNPKFGINYHLNPSSDLYLSIARSNREPVRSDFTDAITDNIPNSEQLTDFEAGWKWRTQNWFIETNLFWMQYKDQLVLTGRLNDVGAPIRTNVESSFRRGVEIQVNTKFTERFETSANVTISQNKIDSYLEHIADYTDGFDLVITELKDKDISFSPNLVGGIYFSYEISDFIALNWDSKYVGDQYLDNTSNMNRSLEAYWVNDVSINLKFMQKILKDATLKFQVRNIFDELYEANGYTYSYIFGDLITENFYYPQAGRNYFVGMNLKF